MAKPAKARSSDTPTVPASVYAEAVAMLSLPGYRLGSPAVLSSLWDW